MPLSDREQQILSDIEARLRDEDPKFAKAVGTTTVSTNVRRKIKFAIAGFVLGFLLLLLLIVDFWFAAGGFALMLISAVYGGTQMKRLGDDQNSHIGGQLRGGFDRYMRDKRDRGGESGQ